MAVLLIMLLALFSPFVAMSSVSPINNTSLCPLDLSYVERLPWNTSQCQNSPEIGMELCCPTLVSLIAIGLAQRLRDTSQFFLPDYFTAAACLVDFQSKLNALSLSPNLVSICFSSPRRLDIQSIPCFGIQSKQDWIRKLGVSTSIDSACRSDLSDLTSCDACFYATMKVQAQLVSLDGNISHATYCLDFSLLYAAGVVNEFSPESTSSAACIFWMPFVSSLASKRKNHIALTCSLTGVALVVVLLCCFFTLHCCWNKYKKKKVQVQSLDANEDKSTLQLKLKLGAIWLDGKELQRATNEFSQKNIVGQGSFSLVYKGTLFDGTLVAIKKIIESNFQGDTQFCKEVEISSNLKHQNLVPLIGCCIITDDNQGKDEEQGKQRYIVYAYMPNGSLHDHLFFNESNCCGSKRNPLNWPQRKSIILDIAKGLAYLHYGIKPAITPNPINTFQISVKW